MSPPSLRATGGIADLLDLVRQVAREGDGPVQVRRCTVGWADDTGTSHVTITPGQDVDLHVTTAQGFPLTARLAAPGGVWRVPAIGEECLVLADPADWDTPGGPIAFCRHRLPPSALTATRAVVEIPAGGELYLGDAATHPLVRGDTYADRLDAYLDALDAALTALTAALAAVSTYAGAVAALPAPFPLTSPAATALATALTTTWPGALATYTSAAAAFRAARTAYLSANLKGE
jgi:hypothetical protein